MKDMADSIAECQQIEQLWHLQNTSSQNISVTSSQIMLSHSDIGPYIHIFCPEGHHVVGPGMITCMKGGTWDDPTRPYCSASPYFGIPASDIVLIATIAGSAAIIIFTLTVVLAYLLCFRTKQRHGLPSRDPLGQSIESIPSTAASFQHKIIRTPMCLPGSATRIGHPATCDPGQRVGQISSNLYDSNECQPYRTRAMHDDSSDVASSYYADPYHVTDGHSSSPPPPPPPLLYDAHNGYSTAHAHRRTAAFAENEAMFSNRDFLEDRSRNYASNWNNEYASASLVPLSPTPDVHIQPLYRIAGTTVF